MIKDKMTTCITLTGEWGRRAMDLKEKGIDYVEMFRQGVQYCEEYLEIKKGASYEKQV
jgi:hypothetical protein